jgi:hypothetical protein
VTVVLRVIAGEVVELDTVPVNPLAAITETDVTVPLPPPPPDPEVALSAIYNPSPGVISNAPAALAWNQALAGIPPNTSTELGKNPSVAYFGTPAVGAATVIVGVALPGAGATQVKY